MLIIFNNLEILSIVAILNSIIIVENEKLTKTLTDAKTFNKKVIKNIKSAQRYAFYYYYRNDIFLNVSYILKNR